VAINPKKRSRVRCCVDAKSWLVAIEGIFERWGLAQKHGWRRPMETTFGMMFGMMNVRLTGKLSSRENRGWRCELLSIVVLHNMKRLDFLEYDGRRLLSQNPRNHCVKRSLLYKFQRASVMLVTGGYRHLGFILQSCVSEFKSRAGFAITSIGPQMQIIHSHWICRQRWLTVVVSNQVRTRRYPMIRVRL